MTDRSDCNCDQALALKEHLTEHVKEDLEELKRILLRLDDRAYQLGMRKLPKAIDHCYGVLCQYKGED